VRIFTSSNDKYTALLGEMKEYRKWRDTKKGLFKILTESEEKE